jgi:hypothetical protein
MHYIYLHGFNSAYGSDSQKVVDLSTIGEVSGITYDTFDTFSNIFKYIVSQVPDSSDVVFVGTSLGGFWAAQMGHYFGVPSIIINPCTDPFTMLRKYVGMPQVNYQTGEEQVLTDRDVDTYYTAPLKSCKKTFGVLPLVLLDMGDVVIASRETVVTLEGFPTNTWEGGSHRFEHMKEALEHIAAYVNHASYVCNT